MGATVVITLVGAVAVSAPARAVDAGDGTLACVVGEICFARDNPPTDALKHYYWDDYDHYDKFFSGTSTRVWRNISADWNRDTACEVWIFSYYWEARQDLLSYRGSGYAGVGAIWNDKNSGHYRCYY